MSEKDIREVVERISKAIMDGQEKLWNEKFKHVISSEICSEKMYLLEAKINKPLWMFLGACFTCGGIGTVIGVLAKAKGLL